MDVWVLEFEATGPQGGDYDGWTSVHKSKDGALLKLFDRIADLGIDPRSPDVQVVAGADADNGSTTGDLEANGWQISYGVNRFPVQD